MQSDTHVIRIDVSGDEHAAEQFAVALRDFLWAMEKAVGRFDVMVDSVYLDDEIPDGGTVELTDAK